MSLAKGTLPQSTGERCEPWLMMFSYIHSPDLPHANGTAERSIKRIRRRVKTMDGFKSQPGAMNFITVSIQYYNGLRQSTLTYTRLSRKRSLKLQTNHPQQA